MCPDRDETGERMSFGGNRLCGLSRYGVVGARYLNGCKTQDEGSDQSVANRHQ